MLEWLAAVGLLVVVVALLPPMLRRAKATRRKSGGSGVMVAIGMTFAMIFDPKAVQATEQIARKKEIGDAEAGESGDKPD